MGHSVKQLELIHDEELRIPAVESGLAFGSQELEEVEESSDFFQLLDSYGLYSLTDPLQHFLDCWKSEPVHAFPPWLQSRVCGLVKSLFTLQWVGNFHPDEVGALDLPYFLESQGDLECSLTLAQGGCFKQANQSLRSSLECLVAQAYFLSQKLKGEDLRFVETMPRFGTTSQGMVGTLVRLGILSEAEGKDFLAVYRFLGLAVHSQWRFTNVWFEEDPGEGRFFLWVENWRTVAGLDLLLLLRICDRRLGLLPYEGGSPAEPLASPG